jgi:hypothetical protein
VDNFPPVNPIPIDPSTIVGTRTGLTASLPADVFFTAPSPGLYEIAAGLRIVATDTAGTLAMTITIPHGGTLSAANGSVIDPDLPNGDNGHSWTVAAWMDTGQTVKVAVEAAGLTATTYSVYLAATRKL